jgi:hypothetical protein
MDTSIPDVSVNGFQATHDFSVAVNGKMFRAAIDGVYSDKIRAPVREYCTNAYDGHLRAGKGNVPFDVQLPTEFEPIFKVRDYGCSMSEEDVLNRFTRLYASDKDESDDEVGGIGIGCKSAFAYTNTFTVRTWRNGTMRVYICFIGPKGFPQCTVQAPEISDEPDGVEIQFPVKRGDVGLFRTAAEYTFAGFDPKPNLLNKTITLNYPQVLLEGAGYKIVKDSSGPRARQGCVIYPINSTIISSGAQSVLWRSNIIVDFPIGKLTVATSREALGNDERTKKAIIERFKEIEAEIRGKLQARVDKEPDYLSACLLKINSTGQYGSIDYTFWTTYGTDLKYNGEALTQYLQFGDDVNSHVFSERVLESSFPHVAAPKNWRKTSLDVRKHKQTLILFEPEELTTFIPTRIRTILLDKNYRDKYDDFIWVQCTRGRFMQLRRQLHNPAYVDLSTIEPTKATPAQRSQIKVKMPTTSWNPSSSYRLRAESLDIEAGGVYVRLADDRYTLLDGTVDYYHLSNHLKSLYRAGVFAGTDRIWCFTKAHTKHLNNPKWQDITPYVQAKLKSMVNVKNFLREKSMAELPGDSTVRFLQKCHEKKVNLPTEITDFLVRLEKELKSQTPVADEVLNMHRRYFPGELEKLQASVSPLLAELSAIKTKWPLLAAMGKWLHYNSFENSDVEHYISLIK